MTEFTVTTNIKCKPEKKKVNLDFLFPLYAYYFTTIINFKVQGLLYETLGNLKFAALTGCLGECSRKEMGEL